MTTHSRLDDVEISLHDRWLDFPPTVIDNAIEFSARHGSRRRPTLSTVVFHDAGLVEVVDRYGIGGMTVELIRVEGSRLVIVGAQLGLVVMSKPSAVTITPRVA